MAVSAASIQSPGSSKNPKLSKVNDVEIDKSGKFKYILVKVHDPDVDREFKHIVRGVSKAEYHGEESLAETLLSKLEMIQCSQDGQHPILSIGRYADIFDGVTPTIEARGLDCECVGGGRIHHEPSKKAITVYGYSQGFGRADHAITTMILQRKYTEYDKITWTNEGY